MARFLRRRARRRLTPELLPRFLGTPPRRRADGSPWRRRAPCALQPRRNGPPADKTSALAGRIRLNRRGVTRREPAHLELASGRFFRRSRSVSAVLASTSADRDQRCGLISAPASRWSRCRAAAVVRALADIVHLSADYGDAGAASRRSSDAAAPGRSSRACARGRRVPVLSIVPPRRAGIPAGEARRLRWPRLRPRLDHPGRRGRGAPATGRAASR
jgi:hypothetical protein